MATSSILAKTITLKYADDGSFTFSKFDSAATDEQLYELADSLNGFQTETMVKLVKVTTHTIS